MTADAAEFAKKALAGLALHCASRPRAERIAWTVNFQDPLLNVFVAGDNPAGTLIVNTFTEDVKVAERCMFYSDTLKVGAEPRRSVIDFDGGDFFQAVERFYASSEQRPARLFEISEDDFVLISAQPDCDVDWLMGLDLDAIRDLDKSQELSLLEERQYQFSCGCDQAKMLNVLAPLYREDAAGLIGDDEVIRITCPRCGAKHAITREALEARVGQE